VTTDFRIRTVCQILGGECSTHGRDEIFVPLHFAKSVVQGPGLRNRFRNKANNVIDGNKCGMTRVRKGVLFRTFDAANQLLCSGFCI